jgi:poly-gamma-glutamate capsule biosynthesis protein CapA/YwtB (metallophosphatase superfamily)
MVPRDRSLRSLPTPHRRARLRGVKLFLCGDVMTGRGIDQILPHPGRPQLYEPYMRSAQGYVDLAEQASGPIPRPAGFDYIWGDALAVLEREHPDARIVNLETAVTTAEGAWPAKSIHYRMHPDNVGCLCAAGIDCCVLANNHVLDWGYDGLRSTLATLHAAGVRTAGAGPTLAAASAPAIVDAAAGSRVLVFAMGMASAGVMEDWAATRERPGVNFLHELSQDAVRAIAHQVGEVKGVGDVVVVSIHWGSNWGYGVLPAQREFAHRLIDEAGVDVVHGHSSHHPIGIEVYGGRLVLYGCGDFINDYEGIGGYEVFRPDLTAAYFPSLDATGRLAALTLTPMRIDHLRVNRATIAEARWLAQALTRASRDFGVGIAVEGDGDDPRLVVGRR